jgi:hypothetical protein
VSAGRRRKAAVAIEDDLECGIVAVYQIKDGFYPSSSFSPTLGQADEERIAVDAVLIGR